MNNFAALVVSARHRVWSMGPSVVAVVLMVVLLATACSPADEPSATADTTTDTTTDTTADTAGSAAETTSSSDPVTSSVDEPVADAAGDAAGDVADTVMEDDAEEAEAMEEDRSSAESALQFGTDDEAVFAPAAGAVPSPTSTGGGLYEGQGEARASRDNADPDAEGLFASDPAEDNEQTTARRLRDNRFADYGYREFIDVARDPFSTFALDVDTGSWTVARRYLSEGVLPPTQAVRVEEFVNAFDYSYAIPRRGLELTIEGGPSPFNQENVLVQVGVQAEVVADADRPPVALTFVIDTSGSMDQDNRLGLVKESLSTLVGELESDDTVAIVVYSDGAGVVLEPTEIRNRDRIQDAIDSLRPGGSTNLESGLDEGYEMARRAFREDGINRVIIASDGVANAGITDVEDLSRGLRDGADAGIQLVTLGFGMGNFNDEMMEQLADNGDGFYAYVDTLDEADRLFRDELTSTLVTAAIDAKIQVEFFDDVAQDYRLIGFENRGVRDSDFRNDQVDAGELGSGHQATAMYELTLKPGVTLGERADIGMVYLRWEDPVTGEVIEIDDEIELRKVEPSFTDTSGSFQLATVATAFADVLRDNPYADDVELRNVSVEAWRLADRFGGEDSLALAEAVDRAVQIGA